MSDSTYTGNVEIALHIKSTVRTDSSATAEEVRKALLEEAKRIVNGAAWQSEEKRGRLAFGKVLTVSWVPPKGE